MRRTHDPPCLRGRGRRLRRHAQHQTSDARGLGCQRQLAAGDEIELSRLTPGFQHHGAHRIAGERVGGGPQHIVHIGRAHGHQPARIETEFGQSAHRQRPRFNFAEILTHPDQRTPRRHPSCEAYDEAGRGPALPSLGEHLMHHAGGKPALQRRIGAGMTERHPVERVGLAGRLEALDAPSQIRKRVCACADHGAAPRKI
jgi:hypothetical protein